MRNRLSLSYSKRFLDHHAPGSHPENANRLHSMSQWFEPGGKYATFAQIQAQALDEALLTAVHSRELVSELKRARGHRGWFDPDTYYSPQSSDVAFLAAESCVQMAQSVFEKDHDCGFALVRPPGHHARRDHAMGFCLLNNIALAAAALRQSYPNSKIAIVDFDLHHGNGTQEFFYEDPDVLFVSSHRFPYYPGTGSLEQSGSGRGRGFTVNLPLDRSYSGDFVLRLYQEIVQPILKQFAPDIILCSAGFDGHQDDPMEGLGLKESHFVALTQLLQDCAASSGKGRLVYCLEGGYNPDALASSVSACIDTLAGQAPEMPVQASFAENEELAERILRHQSQFWKL